MKLDPEILSEIKAAVAEAFKESGYVSEDAIADRVYVRRMRKTSEKVVNHTLITVAAAVVSGIIYAVLKVAGIVS